MIRLIENTIINDEKAESQNIKQWPGEKYELHKLEKLTSEFEKIDTPKKIKIPLFESQKTSVAAMIRVENKGGLWFNDHTRNIYISRRNRDNINWGNKIHRVFIKSNIGVLSNPLGSGKTLEILSLIAEKSMPKAHTTTLRLEGIGDKIFKNPSKFSCPILNITKKVRKILRPALIFSGRPALKQWLYAIETQTHLRVFLISHVRELAEFKLILNAGGINNYDIILVKHGTVSGTVVLPKCLPKEEREPINDITHMELYNVICNMTRDKCWSRVIIDDFDQIDFPENFGQMNALFTWYVSCTKGMPKQSRYIITCRKYNNHVTMYAKLPHTIGSHLYNTYLSYYELLNNKVIFTNFNVCCTDQFIKDIIHIGKPMFYTYTLKNPNNVFIAALGVMGDEKNNDIFQMLNADALEEAAELAGIASMDTKDIFQKILDDKFGLWEKSRNILKFIKVESDPHIIHLRLPLKTNPNKNDTYNKSHLRILRPIKYHYYGLDKLMMEEKYHWFTVKTENGKSIERVQKNLQASICAICSCSLVVNIINDDNEDDEDDIDDYMADILGDVELESSYTAVSQQFHSEASKQEVSKSVIMMKCCGVTLCSECGIRGSNFRRSIMYGRQNKEVITGLCSNCKIKILFNDLIFINKDFDHDKIILENLECENSSDAKCPVESDETGETKEKEAPKKNRDKLDVLMDIINSVVPCEQKQHEKTIPGLMVGKKNLSMATKKETKVLIFANFEETLNNIEKRLNGEIKYHRLGGTANQIHNAAILYNTTDKLNVLLVNSIKYCASLNLQSTTDVVFIHKILNKHIESQTIGRAQRIGRKYELRVHYILYDNEKDYL